MAAFALLLAGMASPAIASPQAITNPVTIRTFAFSPQTVTVSVGDSVTWTNQDPTQHSAKATGGSFDTQALAPGGGAKTITFDLAGTFAYVCAFHPSTMSGTVIVRAAVTPQPTVAPTPVPTVRTAQPTPVPTTPPTVAPTPQPTVATTAPATTAPATNAATSSLPATTAPVAVASPASTANASSASADGGPGPLIIGGAVAIVLGLAALAWVLLRR